MHYMYHKLILPYPIIHDFVVIACFVPTDLNYISIKWVVTIVMMFRFLQ